MLDKLEMTKAKFYLLLVRTRFGVKGEVERVKIGAIRGPKVRFTKRCFPDHDLFIEMAEFLFGLKDNLLIFIRNRYLQFGIRDVRGIVEAGGYCYFSRFSRVVNRRVRVYLLQR